MDRWAPPKNWLGESPQEERLRDSYCTGPLDLASVPSSLGLQQWHFGFWRQGDVSETIRIFFEQSKSFPPAAKSLLTIQEVDAFLLHLSKLTKEDEQQQALQDIASR